MNRHRLSMTSITSLVIGLMGAGLIGAMAYAPSVPSPAARNAIGQAAPDQNKPAAPLDQDKAKAAYVQGGNPQAQVDAREDGNDPDKKITAEFAHLPLSFEANRGQAPSRADYIAKGRGYTLLLAARGAALALKQPVKGADPAVVTRAPQAMLDIELIGADRKARVEPLEALPGKVNYYVGNDSKSWLTDIPTFARVSYHRVYPGIDLTYYGNQRTLEYDFTVAPGADPKAIRLRFSGARKLRIDGDGNLVIKTNGGQIQQRKPVVYQERDGVNQEVPGRFVLKGRQVAFAIGSYDRTRPLVIDPTLTYSSFLGGDGEDPAFAVAVDPAGNLYLTGVSNSLSPGTVPFDLLNPWGAEGAICCGGNDTGRVFVTKMNPTQTALIFSTYLGGFAGTDQVRQPCPLDPAPGCGGNAHFARGWDSGFGIAADTAGNAYVGGWAESLDFPTTADAVRRSHPGPSCGGTSTDPDGKRCNTTFYVDHPRDGFLAIFGPTGTLTYSSLIGGHGSDGVLGIDVVDTGPGVGIYLTGLAQSVDFFGPSPGTGNYLAVNAFQTQLNVNPTHVLNATPPASCHDAATNDNNWACWRDAFAMRLGLDGKTVIYSTLFGGTGDDGGFGVKDDPATGNAHYVGGAESTDFPTTPSVAQECLAGGGNGAAGSFAYPADLGLQSAGMIPFACHLSPSPQTADYPTQAQKPPEDAYVAKFGPTGTLLFSTYLGGSSDDASGDTQDDKAGDFGKTVGLDNLANIYVTGWTESFDSTKPPANPPHNPPVASTTTNGQQTNCGPIVGNAQFGTQPCPTYAGFPTTLGVFQDNLAQSSTAACGTGAPADCVPPNKRPHANAFVTKLTPTGTLAAPGYSTYIGGFGDDAAFGLAVDSLGQAYIAGSSDSTNFPITTGKTIAHPTPTAPGATPCPNCGSNINGILGPYDEDNPPQASDAFITKFNPTASGATALLYSSYLGGSNDEVVHGIVHSTRAGAHGIYITGLTTSSTLVPPPKPPDPPGSSPPTPPWPSPWFGYPTTPDAFQATSSPDRTVVASPPNDQTPLPSIPNEEVFIARLNDNADESPAPPVGAGGGPVTPDFSLAASPTSMSIPLAGAGTGSFTVSTSSAGGFHDPIALNATVSPSTGLTVSSPSPTTVTWGGTSYPVKMFNISTATPGTYQITITGTSGSKTHTATVAVTVVAPDFSIVVNPTSVSFPQVGGNATFSVAVTAVGGLSQNVTITPAPTSGLTFNPTSKSVAPGLAGSFTVTASTPNTYTVTITGSCTGCKYPSGDLSHNTTLIVTARPADFSLSATPNTLTVSKDGGSAPTVVTITPIDNFSGTITLTPTWNGTHPGLSITPPPPPVTRPGPPYATTTFTVTSTAAAVPGTYTVTITGTGGSPSLSRTTPVTVYVPSNTGFRSPTANSAANTSGDGNGFEVNPTNAYSDDGVFAVDTDSGGSTGNACNSGNKDSHRFSGYGFTIPSGATITGIQVRLDAKVDSTAGTPKMCVQLVGGSGAGVTKSTPLLTTSEATSILGGAGVTWGKSWTPANFGTFQVRIINVSSDPLRDFSLDWVAVKVHYR